MEAVEQPAAAIMLLFLLLLHLSGDSIGTSPSPHFKMVLVLIAVLCS